MRHFVVAGCSYTRNGEIAWSYFLEKLLIKKFGSDKIQFHNVAISGIGNDLISFNCINIIQSLLDSGVNCKDITVIIQWSGLNRQARYYEGNFPKTTGLIEVDFQEIKDEFFGEYLYDNTHKFLNTAGKGKFELDHLKNYFKYYFTPPETFRHTLDCILKTQWYLKSVAVDYKMFNGWDIFTTSDRTSKNVLDRLLKGGDKTNQFADKTKYVNIDNILYSAIFPHLILLWNMVDLNNFWTFRNKKVKLGGMTQWIQYKVPNTLWYVSNRDKHPSATAAHKFAKDVIYPMVIDIVP